jgi:AGZA family xanthine/uracil permease-like MFS transporter
MHAGSAPAATPDLKTEIAAGVTTFFTMAYIVIVNPIVLTASDAGGTGMPFAGVLSATVLVSVASTLLMGLYARLPFALAPGMGLNAFVSYGVILGQGVPWPTALGLVFLSGVVFVIISVTPVREQIALAIPSSLRTAAAAGIGAFLTFIGLKNAGVVVASPATFVTTGPLGAGHLQLIVGLLVTVALMKRKSPIALLAGIVAATITAALAGKVTVPDAFVSAPDFSLVGALDIGGALQLGLVPVLIALIFTDLFDSLSTFVGVAEAADLKDEQGQPTRLREGLLVDAFATLSASLVGSSAGTTYIESAAGIEAGGRTGRVAVVVALCFLPCLLLGPVVGMVPAAATSATLVIVGALMFKAALRLQLDGPEEILPVFLTVLLIPLTFSITQGMLWGFLSHVVLFTLAGRAREVTTAMWVIGALAAGLLALGPG